MAAVAEACGAVSCGQLTVSAVSSMTNDVSSEESSVPVNLTVTVCPAKAARSYECWVYGPALRLENTCNVVVPTCTVSLSYCLVVVVSAVLIFRWNDRAYELQPLGRVTDWD